MERWHRALGAELRGHGAGRAIADAANFVFLGLVLSGIVLWFPRNWTAQRVRAASFFRRGLSGRAVFWNIHNVGGIWCATPLFFVVLTGVIMSYAWANNLLYRVSGSEPPPANAPRGEGNTPSHAGPHGPSPELQPLFDRAEQQTIGWRSITLRLPAGRAAVFAIDAGNGGKPNKRAQLTLDARTGNVRKREPFSSYSTGRRMRAWARFVHTGEAGGIAGEVIAAVAALGGVFLVATGLTMAWIRLRSALERRNADRVTIADQDLARLPQA
jgi:uncharacterized iron-regulated membrane protein